MWGNAMDRIIVIFVKDTEHDGEINAVFPELLWSEPLYGRKLVTCYAHRGQHSSCSRDWVMDDERRIATEDEYMPLLKELKDIGYGELIITQDKSIVG